MLSGIDAFNSTFLADLATTENRITQTSEQISSGIRVNEASDDPAAVAPILEYQSQIDQVTQVQANLNLASTDAQTADAALQSASSLLDQLVSIAAQGASSTSSATNNAVLSEQVQNIEQQLVSLANTTSRGYYVFGGDNPTTAPYTFDWSQPKGVVQNSTAGITSVLRNASGGTITPGMTAQQIFDVQLSGGASAPGNIFQAAYDLGQALAANNSAGIQNASAELKAAVTQLGTATSTYGALEDWIQQASADASSRLTSLQSALSSVRDTDLPAAATDLSLEQSALQAALSAHGSLDDRSLFSFLG